jgi:hypothetical protein
MPMPGRTLGGGFYGAPNLNVGRITPSRTGAGVGAAGLVPPSGRHLTTVAVWA